MNGPKIYCYKGDPEPTRAVQWTGTPESLNAVTRLVEHNSLVEKFPEGVLKIVRHGKIQYLVQSGDWVFPDGGTCSAEYFAENWEEVTP